MQQSTTEEIQGRNSRQLLGLGGDAEFTQECCLLTCSLWLASHSLPLLDYTLWLAEPSSESIQVHQNRITWEIKRGGSFHSNHWSRKRIAAGLSRGELSGDIFSGDILLSTIAVAWSMHLISTKSDLGLSLAYLSDQETELSFAALHYLFWMRILCE